MPPAQDPALSPPPVPPPPSTGKIARLPRHIRNQLGGRLANGDQDPPTLAWLNRLPELDRPANSPPGQDFITEQDLAHWKQHGYQRWLADDQACQLVRELAEHADDLYASADELPVSDCLSAFLATELARSAKSLLAESASPAERWQRLRELLQELARLRKEDHQALRVQMERERWDREQRRLDDEQQQHTIRKLKDQATAPIWARAMQAPLAAGFGGGELGAKLAELITAIEYELPIPGHTKPEPPRHEPSNPPTASEP